MNDYVFCKTPNHPQSEATPRAESAASSTNAAPTAASGINPKLLTNRMSASPHSELRQRSVKHAREHPSALQPSELGTVSRGRQSGVQRQSRAASASAGRESSAATGRGRDPYANVRSVVGEYRRSEISLLDAQYHSRSLSHARSQSRAASASGGGAVRRAPSTPRGPPRCAEEIPERYKYHPKTEEEKEADRELREELREEFKRRASTGNNAAPSRSAARKKDAAEDAKASDFDYQRGGASPRQQQQARGATPKRTASNTGAAGRKPGGSEAGSLSSVSPLSSDTEGEEGESAAQPPSQARSISAQSHHSSVWSEPPPLDRGVSNANGNDDSSPQQKEARRRQSSVASSRRGSSRARGNASARSPSGASKNKKRANDSNVSDAEASVGSQAVRESALVSRSLYASPEAAERARSRSNAAGGPATVSPSPAAPEGRSGALVTAPARQQQQQQGYNSPSQGQLALVPGGEVGVVDGRTVNPYGYRKRLVFPTRVPTVRQVS